MKFKYAAILSTILCLVLNILQSHFGSTGYDISVFFAEFMLSNTFAGIYLLFNIKREKSGLMFLFLQNILALLTLMGS